MTQNPQKHVEFSRMTAAERRASTTLASIIGLRMFGLFLILPVFSLYAEHLEGETHLLIGVALGVYGLTQAMFQIPFGLWSDRIGRKPVITLGLLLFAAGAVVAAMSDSIYGVILGRALQGAGAISAATMALTADLTREEHRTKAMAIIGASVGGAFLLALMAGPILNGIIGVPGIFWVTAVLALGAIAMLHLRIPAAAHTFHRDAEPVPAQFGRILRNPDLMRLNLGIGLLHLGLMAMFVVIPLMLRHNTALTDSEHWKFYLPVLSLSVMIMVPFVLLAEKRNLNREVFIGAIALLGIAQALFALLPPGLFALASALVIFFAAINLLEATLPALVSRMAPVESKGTALGVYSTTQFLGAFIGGTSGGWLYGHFGASAVFGFCAVLTGIWFAFSLPMRMPPRLASQLIKVGEVSPDQARRMAAKLLAVAGVVEAVVMAEDGVAYLKVDRHALDEEALQAFSAPGD